MKKNLFFVAAAALMLASCSNDVKLDENTVPVGSNKQNEIAFSTYAQGPKRLAAKSGAIESTTFPTDLDMMVTAYDATNDGDYFDATAFSYATSTWKGGKYWPLAPATINFLAITNANGDNEDGVTWGTASANHASKVVIVMDDNSSNQYDLMYACGTGTVSQTGNALTFPTNVPMVFKHAQALVKFTVKAGDASYASAITVNSITLNSVSCDGTYTVTHANFDEDKAARDAAGDGSKDGSVSGVWTAYDSNVDDVDARAAAGYSALSDVAQDFASLMVVPNQGMASFTINYSLYGNDYEYTYTPASTTLAQATKYIYNITLTLHEIEIAPEVEDWTDGSTTFVEIPTLAYKENAVAGTYDVANTAGKYSVTISGCKASTTYNVSEAVAADWLAETNSAYASAATSYTSDANGNLTIYFTVTAQAANAAARNATIVLTEDGDTKNTKITVAQAAGPVE